MNDTLREIQKKFMDEITYVDDVAQIVRKGHLVIEEVMTEAIERYVLHGEIVADAKLQFHQKLALCKAISVSEKNNPMWGLIGKINNVRNNLSHSLSSDLRIQKIKSLKSNYEQQFGNEALRNVEEMSEDAAVCMLAISGCLGYLHSFLEEIRQFESLVNALNKSINDANFK